MDNLGSYMSIFESKNLNLWEMTRELNILDEIEKKGKEYWFKHTSMPWNGIDQG